MPPYRCEVQDGKCDVLGVEGSGKTVLTMALAKYFAEHGGDEWYLQPATRNAYRFLEQIPDQLVKETLPSQTSTFKYLALTLRHEQEDIRTIDLLDYPGEVYRLAFLDAEDDTDPTTLQARIDANKEEITELLDHLAQSERVFVLFNPEDGTNVGQNERNLDAVWITNACLDYLHRLPTQPHITLVLTQVDKLYDLSVYDFDPKVYFAHHLPLIYRNFPDVDIVATSVLDDTQKMGLDAIAFRCLKDTSWLQERLASWKECLVPFRQILDYVLNTKSLPSVSVAHEKEVYKEFSDVRKSLAWCCPESDLCRLLNVSSFRTMSEQVLLASTIATVMPDDLKAQMRYVDRTIVMLNQFNLEEDIAISMRDDIIDILRAQRTKLYSQIQKLIAQKQKQEQVEVALALLFGGILIAAIVIFLIFVGELK